MLASLFGQKLDDPQYAVHLRRAVLGFASLDALLAEMNVSRLQESLGRLSTLKTEFERWRPENPRYSKLHKALKKVMEIQALMGPETVLQLAHPLADLSRIGRLERWSADSGRQMAIFLQELSAMTLQERRRLLGEDAGRALGTMLGNERLLIDQQQAS